MKTTVEVSDSLLRKAKAIAAGRGQSMKAFLTEAIAEKLARNGPRKGSVPAWMKFAGTLSKTEAQRINAVVEKEFEQIDPEDWK